MNAIDLHDKLELFDDHWAPRTVAEYNGHDVMVVKVAGEYRWHEIGRASCRERV